MIGQRLDPQLYGVTNEVDMLAQRVGFTSESGWRVDPGDGPLDAVQVTQPLLRRQRAAACRNIALEEGQLAVPPIDPRSPAQAEKLRQEVKDREHNSGKRQQYDDGPLH